VQQEKISADFSSLAIVLTPISYKQDPRHSYWRTELEKKFEFVEVWQFLSSGSLTTLNKAGIAVAVGTEDRDVLDLEASLSSSLNQIYSYLLFTNDESSKALQSLVDQFSSDNSITHQYLLGQVARMTASLALAATVKSPALVVANDLVAAIAAVLVWPNGETRIVYDAQEVFTDMYRSSPADRMTESEERFWIDLESFVCSTVDEVVTISPGIAELYIERHGVSPFVLPNWVPLSSANFAKASDQGPTRFVYMGHAAPHRGLEELITQWTSNKSTATLDLFIPERPYTQDLRKLIERHSKEFPEVAITLRDPVSESQMIHTLSEFDVGVIPYAHPYPYNHCSPNKLGQYLAAGLAVISNELPFVKQIINEVACGHVFDWQIPGSFNECVSKFVADKHLVELKENARTAFLSGRNWEAVIQNWDSETKALVPVTHPRVNQDWANSFVDLATYPDNHEQVIAIVVSGRLTFKQAMVSALGRIGLRDSVRTRIIFIQLSKVPVIGGLVKKVAKSMI
jgi:glycosyltransferase involved in cell wall biosynthesis